MTLGNLLGGWAADRSVMRALFASFAVFAVMLLGLALTAPQPVGLLGFLFGVGVAAAALSPAIQTRLMDVAGESQTLAAAVNHSALNIGNALGAFLGGAVIAAGWGYLAPSWLGLVMCAPGVLLALAGAAASRRVPPSAIRS